jgi:glycosyltransferase involved in cell wall biosynthesis
MRTIVDIRTVSDHFPGIGRYTYQLALGLVRCKDRESLLLLFNPESSNTRFDISALASEPDVRIVATAARPFTAREQLRLPGELQKLSPQATHFPYPIMPYAAPRPFVLTIHDIIPVRFPQYFTVRQRIMYRISLSLALRSAACVICVSEATRSDLISAFRVDSRLLFVVHEGIAESFQPPAKDELQRVRIAYGLPEKYFLYLGSNKPHKNLPMLIDAYARLRSCPPLIVAGIEDSRYTLARRRVDFLDLKDRVRFVGAVVERDLPALYGGALAFVFPSSYEGFGLPPLEAMACGVPVVCSNIPSLCEAVGNAALLFNSEDPAAIAAALERILQDEKLRTNLRDQGFRRAAELPWSLAAEKTMSLYRRAASHKATPIR